LQKPQTPEELAGALREAAASGRAIRMGGAFTKDAMAGPVVPDGVTISTASLDRMLRYEPRDLTVSVEAGLGFAELNRRLAADGLMVPLDPPFGDRATVGGVLGANTSGPLRRLYGAARDLVIGMKYATLEGKLVESGGMVVKNVAGLDTAKLMIGSFGTLAAIAVANFRLVPKPAAWRTFVLRFGSLPDAAAAREALAQTVLQPAAVDLVNPVAAARFGEEGFLLLVRAGGNSRELERYALELPAAQIREGDEEEVLWRGVEEFTPEFLRDHAAGAVVRVSCLLSQVEQVMGTFQGPVVARAGSGVVHGYFDEWEKAGEWMAGHEWKAVIEFAPEAAKARLTLWPCEGGDLAVMRKLKGLFDPNGLLNRGRLYGRI
jgi:glycolate oxidase FAD binding subunit